MIIDEIGDITVSNEGGFLVIRVDGEIALDIPKNHGATNLMSAIKKYCEQVNDEEV